MVPVINNWGHAGGIAAGIGLGFLLGYQEHKKENVFHKLLAGGCAIITILILGRAVLSGLYIRFFV
jgi:rhomboid protease GluP